MEHRKVQQLTYVDSSDVSHTAWGFRVLTFAAISRPQDAQINYYGFNVASLITVLTAGGYHFGFDLSLDLFPVDEFTIVDTPN